MDGLKRRGGGWRCKVNLFYEQVYDVVRQIPQGKVVSYGQIARAIGFARSAREVGRAMRYCSENLPCHRVVMADGSVQGGECAEKRRVKLKEEGVLFISEDRVDMKRHQWDLKELTFDDDLLL